MKTWTKRGRAAIAIGLTWGAAWFAAGMVLLLIVGIGAADVPFPLFFGMLGFFAGVTFSGLLGLFARRRKFSQMSLPHFAGAGALGGVLLSGIVNFAAGPTADLLMLGSIFGLAGAVSASGTLALARRTERQESLDSGAESDKPSLGRDVISKRLGRRS